MQNSDIAKPPPPLMMPAPNSTNNTNIAIITKNTNILYYENGVPLHM